MHCELISVQQNSHPAGIAVRREAWAFPAWTPQTTVLRYLYPSPPSLTLQHTHSPLMTVIPHMSFCPSSLYSAFHRVCPFLIAIWQSVPQSFSRSLFSSSNKYIRHFIKEQSLFTSVYSLSPSSLTLTSSLSLSPSLFSIPFSRSFSVRVKLQRLLADQLLWPICTSSKDTPPSSIPPPPPPSRSSLLLSSDYLMQFSISSIFTNVWIFLQENKTKILIKRYFCRAAGAETVGGLVLASAVHAYPSASG